jgi:hypothetical protein
VNSAGGWAGGERFAKIVQGHVGGTPGGGGRIADERLGTYRSGLLQERRIIKDARLEADPQEGMHGRKVSSCRSQ